VTDFDDLPEGTLVTGNVRAEPTVCPTPDGPMAGLLLRFPLADGSGFHPPVMLVMEDAAMPRAAQHIKKAADTAVWAAQKVRRDAREAEEAMREAQKALEEHAGHETYTPGCKACAIDLVAADG